MEHSAEDDNNASLGSPVISTERDDDEINGENFSKQREPSATIR
jgi:hypothetical protein